MISVLFVCTGNICRSPTAEAVFRALVDHKGLANHILTDSAGTHGYHVGQPPDPRAVDVALRNGVDMRGRRARQIEEADFWRFQHIVAMDRGHLRLLDNLTRNILRPHDPIAPLSLFLRFQDEAQPIFLHDPGRAKESDVIDPYYGDITSFEAVYKVIEEGCQKILTLLAKH